MISVHNSKPVLWGAVEVRAIKEGEIEQPAYALVPLLPSRIAQQTMTAETVAALMAMNDGIVIDVE